MGLVCTYLIHPSTSLISEVCYTQEAWQEFPFKRVLWTTLSGDEHVDKQSSAAGVVVHGTDFAVVKENVAFDIIGNCYYLEDGMEEYNVIEKNLAAFVHVIGCPAVGKGQEGQTFAEVGHKTTLMLVSCHKLFRVSLCSVSVLIV